MKKEMVKNGIKRKGNGTFDVGSIGGPGRPIDTPKSIIIKKATKELIIEYKEALGESLPLIKPILIAKALEGDMTAIKEIHDRVMDKSRQNIGLDGGAEGIVIQLSNIYADKINANTSRKTS